MLNTLKLNKVGFFIGGNGLSFLARSVNITLVFYYNDASAVTASKGL